MLVMKMTIKTITNQNPNWKAVTHEEIEDEMSFILKHGRKIKQLEAHQNDPKLKFESLKMRISGRFDEIIGLDKSTGIFN